MLMGVQFICIIIAALTTLSPAGSQCFFLTHSINSDDKKKKNTLLGYLTDVEVTRQELDDSMKIHKEPEVHGKFEKNYEEDIKVVIRT